MGLEEHELGPSSEAPFSGLQLRVQGGRAVITVAHFSLENVSALIFWCRKSGHKDLPDCWGGGANLGLSPPAPGTTRGQVKRPWDTGHLTAGRASAD